MATLVAKMIFRAKDEVSGKLSKMSANVLNSYNRINRGLLVKTTRMTRRMGRNLTAGISLPAGIAARSIFQTSMAFDEMRNSAQAAGRLSNSAIKPIENLSRNLALSSKFDPTQIMSGAKMLLKSGMSVAAVMGTLAGTVNLAAAGELNLAESADIATNVLTGMNLPMKTAIEAQKSMTRVSDVLAYAASNSNTDVRFLGQSFKFVAPLASKAGISVEELGAAFMVMAQSGIKGSESGVAMRSAIVRMVRPTKGMLGALKGMGISLDDFIKKGKKASASSFMDMFQGSGYNVNPLKKQIGAIFSDESLKKDPQKLIEKLNQVIVEGMGDNSVEGQQKISQMVSGYFGGLAEGVDFKGFIAALSKSKAGLGMIARIFDAKQGGRLATLIGNGQLSEAFAKISKEAKGATDSMAKILMRGSVGDYHRMTSAYQNMLLTIGKSGVMNEAAKIMRGLGSAFSYLSKRADASFGSLNKFFGSKGVDLSKLSPDVRKELSGLLADKDLMEDSDQFAKRVSEVISKGVGDGLSQSKAKELINDYVSTLTDTSPWLKWGVMAIGALAVLGPLTWAISNVVSAAGLMGTGLTAVNGVTAKFGKNRWRSFKKNNLKMKKAMRSSSRNLGKYGKRYQFISNMLGSAAASNIGKRSIFARIGLLAKNGILSLAKAPFKSIAVGIRMVAGAVATLGGSFLLLSWPIVLAAAAIALIYANWDKFKKLWEGFSSKWEGSDLQWFFQKLGKGLGWIGDLISPVLGWLGELLGIGAGNDKDNLTSWFDLGAAAAEKLLNPFKSIKSIIGWIYDTVTAPLNWFGGTSPKVPSAPLVASGRNKARTVPAISGTPSKAIVSAGRNKPRTIPARAKGGDTPSGEVLVGERGPEIVHFKQPGTVIPNHKIDRLAKAKAGAKAAAMAGALALTPVAAAAGTGQGNKSVTINAPITITIDGSSGNAQEIAQQVERVLSQKLKASMNAAMHDGGF